jgi:hypothetical protein
MALQSSKFWLLIAASLCGLGGATPRMAQAEVTAAGDDYKWLEQPGVLEHDFDTALKRAIPKDFARTLNIAGPISINRTPRANGLAIFVVSMRAIRRLAAREGIPREVRDRLPAIERNAVAIHPNMIILDADLASDLIVLGYNALLALANAEMSKPIKNRSDTAEVDAHFEVVSKLGGLAAYLRLAYMEGLGNSPRFARGLLRTSRIFNVEALVGAILVPIIAHEAAHLLQAPAGSGGVGSYFSREDDADRGSLSILPLLKAEHELMLFAAAETANYFRDRAMFTLFDRLRGFRAKELLVDTIQEDTCGRQRYLSRLDYENPARIAYAGLRRYPLLTAQEWKAIRETHPLSLAVQSHNLRRGVQLLKSAAGELPGSWMADVTRLEQGLRSGDPSGILAEASGGRIGLRRAEVTGALRHLHFEPAVTCAPGRCWVGTESGVPGYIELVGESDLESIVLVLPLRRRSSSEPKSAMNQQDRIRDAAMSVGLAMNFLSAVLPKADAGTPAAQQFLMESLACQWVFAERQGDGRVVRIMHLNDTRFVRFEVYPSAGHGGSGR